MIAAGSIVGFALAFVLVAWVLSAAAGALLAWQRRRLGDAGPAAERAASAAALVLPPTLAATAVAGVALAQLGGADHCEEHAHHLHLCLAHGGEWAARVLPVALVSALGAALTIHVGRAALQMLAARRVIGALRRAGRVLRHDGCEVIVAPSPHRLSLTAGIVHPRVYVSTAVWDALDDGERAAVLGHEAAHARGHDVLWSLILGGFAMVGAPGVNRHILRSWREATERLRDHDAAIAAGDPAIVGSALLKVARVPAAPRMAATVGISADADLAGRVEALLAGGPVGQPVARWIGLLAWIGGVAALALSVIWTGPLHHALETLLSPL